MPTLSELFSDIANAIRDKSGSSATIVAANFPTAISNMPAVTVGTSNGVAGQTAGSSTNNSLTITELIGKQNVVIIRNDTSGSFKPSRLTCWTAARYGSTKYTTLVASDGTIFTDDGDWDSTTGTYTVGSGRQFISGSYYWIAW